LDDKQGALKLTTAYYFSPSGRNIQRRPGEKEWGVDPTDGYYLALDGRQNEALLEKRQQRELLGLKVAPKKDGKVTPQSLKEEHPDPQLGAALETLTAKLTKGDFVKVGKPNAAMLAQVARREEIEKRRASLMRSLEQVNQELAEVEKAIHAEEKPPKE